VQSKICALNFHTKQQQELFSHLLHLQRWQVGAGSQARWFAAVDPVSRDTGAAQWKAYFFTTILV